MRENETLTQAKYIFSTGKMIRDRIFRVQTTHLAACGKSNALGDLSVPQFHAIMIVRTLGQVTMTELSDSLGVSPPSAGGAFSLASIDIPITIGNGGPSCGKGNLDPRTQR